MRRTVLSVKHRRQRQQPQPRRRCRRCGVSISASPNICKPHHAQHRAAAASHAATWPRPAPRAQRWVGAGVFAARQARSSRRLRGRLACRQTRRMPGNVLERLEFASRLLMRGYAMTATVRCTTPRVSRTVVEDAVFFEPLLPPHGQRGDRGHARHVPTSGAGRGSDASPRNLLEHEAVDQRVPAAATAPRCRTGERMRRRGRCRSPAGGAPAHAAPRACSRCRSLMQVDFDRQAPAPRSRPRRFLARRSSSACAITGHTLALRRARPCR